MQSDRYIDGPGGGKPGEERDGTFLELWREFDARRREELAAYD
jgi:hypothetical protein